MLTPPDGLSHDALAQVLCDGWGVAVASVEYRAVGFGSHHWEVVDAEGVRRFVTVDDLDGKRHSRSEPETAALRRLRAALATATDLRQSGATYVVAPIPTLTGTPLVLLDSRFGVALYPFVDGESFSWGELPTAAHRRGVLDLLVALHATPATPLRHVMTDDFAVPHREELEPISGRGEGATRGPYTRRTSRLLAENGEALRRLSGRYDELVEQAGRTSGVIVVTHGEPHPGNTMLTAEGWVLIDWDTVLLAPAERDLWSLDPGDGSIIGAYADATATVPCPRLLELYRIRWDLTDIADFVSRFHGPHADSPDDAKSWDELCSLVGGLPA